MKYLLAVVILIPNLLWGLTFKNGKQVEDFIETKEVVKKFNNDFKKPKSVLISNEIYDQIISLPTEEKIKSCGFNVISVDWATIDKGLPNKIEGYNSRMDNDSKVEGSYARGVFYAFSTAATYVFLNQDEKLKEKLFDKLYQWASDEALLGTKVCYNRTNDGKKIRAECEGEWSDPNGQDLAPIKDASLSIEIAIGLNYIYDLLLEDYLINDPRHEIIKSYFNQWHKRVPLTKDFFWGLQMNYAVPNILIAQQSGEDSTDLVARLAKGANEWINTDGSLKNRTTRGNRALWYHHTAMAEAMMVMELSKAAKIELPKDYEENFLKAADLYHKAYLDHSYITPWAKEAHNSQFNPSNADFQDFPDQLNKISFEGWWMWVFQYRYPDNPLSLLFKEKLSKFSASIRGDLSYGLGLGCIYKTLLK